MAVKTFENFLRTYTSPYSIWASKSLPADVAEPDKNKVLQGWTIEKPKHSIFNWHMNRTDTRLKQLEAKIEFLEGLLREKGILEE